MLFLNDYVSQLITSREGLPEDPDARVTTFNGMQKGIEGVMNSLVTNGHGAEAGLLMQMNRHIVEFGGYNTNAKASGDVKAFFNHLDTVPDEGVIVFDYFVTRNLPAFVEECEQRGILDRVRVVVPEGVLVAQLAFMDDAKKAELEQAISKLGPDNFVIENVNHVGDIKIQDDIAAWFSVRAWSIYPGKQAETAEETTEAMVEAFRGRLNKVVEGGLVFSYNAVNRNGYELVTATIGAERRIPSNRTVAAQNVKLPSTITSDVAEGVSATMRDLGFNVLSDGEFKEVPPEFTEHNKFISQLVARRRLAELDASA